MDPERPLEPEELTLSAIGAMSAEELETLREEYRRLARNTRRVLWMHGLGRVAVAGLFHLGLLLAGIGGVAFVIGAVRHSAPPSLGGLILVGAGVRAARVGSWRQPLRLRFTSAWARLYELRGGIAELDLFIEGRREAGQGRAVEPAGSGRFSQPLRA